MKIHISMMWQGTLLMLSVTCAAAAPFNQNGWPPIKSGTWDVIVVNPQGKKDHHQLMNCAKPYMLFWGYFGSANLSKTGCEFSSEHLADHHYLLTGLCRTEAGTMTVMKHHIKVDNDSSFEDAIGSTTDESANLTYFMRGRWMKGCEP